MIRDIYECFQDGMPRCTEEAARSRHHADITRSGAGCGEASPRFAEGVTDPRTTRRDCETHTWEVPHAELRDAPFNVAAFERGWGPERLS